MLLSLSSINMHNAPKHFEMLRGKTSIRVSVLSVIAQSAFGYAAAYYNIVSVVEQRGREVSLGCVGKDSNDSLALSELLCHFKCSGNVGTA